MEKEKAGDGIEAERMAEWLGIVEVKPWHFAGPRDRGWRPLRGPVLVSESPEAGETEKAEGDE